MKDQHEKIKGYRDLSQEEIDLMNDCKKLAERCGCMIEELQGLSSNDQECIELAKIKLKEGFMWAIRGIAQPTSF